MHDYEIDTRLDTPFAHPHKLQEKAPPWIPLSKRMWIDPFHSKDYIYYIELEAIEPSNYDKSIHHHGWRT
jgi:hypothetical protein